MNAPHTLWYQSHAESRAKELAANQLNAEAVNQIPFAELRLAAKMSSRNPRYANAPLQEGAYLYDRCSLSSLGAAGQILVTAALGAAAAHTDHMVEPQHWGNAHDVKTSVSGLREIEVRTATNRADGSAIFGGPDLSKCDSLIMVSLPHSFKLGIDSDTTRFMVVERSTLEKVAEIQGNAHYKLGPIGVNLTASLESQRFGKGIQSLIRSEGTQLNSYAEFCDWASYRVS